MQISDYVSQYSQNVNPQAEPVVAKKGVERLVSSVRQMTVGNIFEGTVNSVKNGKVVLGLSNGKELIARMDGKVGIQVGQSMFFQVKSNDGNLLAIKPFTVDGNRANLTLMNALKATNLPLDARNLSMVNRMMEEQMPIDKNSLMQMARIAMAHPDIDVQTLVQMQKLHLPISAESASQFENYLANQQAITNDLDAFMNTLPQTMADDGLSLEQLTQLNQQLLTVITEETGQEMPTLNSNVLSQAADAMTQSGEMVLEGAESALNQSEVSASQAFRADNPSVVSVSQMPGAANSSEMAIPGEQGTANLTEASVSGEQVQANPSEAPVSGEQVRANSSEASVSGEQVQANPSEASVSGEQVQANPSETSVSGAWTAENSSEASSTVTQTAENSSEASNTVIQTAEGLSETSASGGQTAANSSVQVQSAENPSEHTVSTDHTLQADRVIIQSDAEDIPLQNQTGDAAQTQPYQPGTLGSLFDKTQMFNLYQQIAANPQLADRIEQALGQQLDEYTQIQDLLSALKDALSSGTFTQKVALQKLFGGKEMQSLMKESLKQQWTIRPEELPEQGKVRELYEKIDHQVRSMEEAVRSSGGGNENFHQAAGEIKNNISFMNQVNEVYTYVQVPLKMSGQTANGELYVYTNKKNLSDPERDLTAFLHLDMEHLGSTDVSLRMHKKEVSTNFYFDNDESFALVKEHVPELEERLRKKGYNCKISVTNEAKHVNFVEDFLKKDQPSTGMVRRYSFDMRA